MIFFNIFSQDQNHLGNHKFEYLRGFVINAREGGYDMVKWANTFNILKILVSDLILVLTNLPRNVKLGTIRCGERKKWAVINSRDDLGGRPFTVHHTPLSLPRKNNFIGCTPC